MYLSFVTINIINFLTGVVSALFISRFIEPSYDNFVDLLKNNDGIIGRIYAGYSRLIGHIFYSKKLHKALKFKGWEYKIYIFEGKVSCYRSDIVSLRQTFFGGIIQGEMNRKHLSKNSHNTYFKAYIKRENTNYLIWEERFRGKEGNLHISAKYKLSDQCDSDSVGISIEQHEDKIVQSLSLLSFSKRSYAAVSTMANQNKEVAKYLTSFCINIDNISDESNKIITV